MAVRSAPATLTLPPSAPSSPPMRLRNVDLPEPEGPSMTHTSRADLGGDAVKHLDARLAVPVVLHKPVNYQVGLCSLHDPSPPKS